MSNRLRRKSRPQGDVQLYGGPLKQTSFKGGINLDRPASEIGDDQLANAENVICFERHVESRPGTKKATVLGWTMPGSGTYHAFHNNPSSLDDVDSRSQYLLHRGSGLYYLSNPLDAVGRTPLEANYSGSGSAFSVDSDSTARPFMSGHLLFTSSKIVYVTSGGWFQINAPNPVYGMPDDTAAADTFVRRYLVVLSRVTNGPMGTVVANRKTSGAIIEHESGTNANQAYVAGTVARNVDYATVNKTTAWSTTNPYNVTSEMLQGAFSSLGSADANTAARHFTHVSLYCTLDLGSSGLNPETQKPNPRDEYIWLADVKREDIVGISTTVFVDNIDDNTLRQRLEANDMLLGTRGFEPLPSGACGESTPAFIFTSNRVSTNKKSTVYYSQVDNTPQNMGYYFPGSQYKQFGDVIVALRATQDVLSIFGLNSTHTCTLTSWFELGRGQSAITLNHWTTVDETLGVRDWGTISQVDRNTLIAVCSDASVRLWDTTKWGEDISYNSVNSEIVQMVPANPANVTTGSFGVFHKGSYRLWYSKSTSDTKLTNCLRYGFGGRAGFGWTVEKNGIQIPFRCGATAVIDDANRIQRLMAISTTTVTNGFLANDVYWLDTFDAFSGATEHSSAFGVLAVDGKSSGGAGSAAGTEIVSRIKFREMTASEESEEIVHQETHAYFRPISEAVGYRSGFEVSLAGYVNGSQTSSETISNIPKTGDWHFTQELSGRRLQLEIITTTGQFRLVGVDSHCRSLDRVNYATAGDNSSSESTTSDAAHQAALATSLKHWATRQPTTRDLATGTLFTVSGTSVSAATGPDLKDSSAQLFSSAVYTESASYTYNAFSVLFGVKFISTLYTGNVVTIAGGTDPLTVSFTNSTTLSFSGLGTVTITAISADTWAYFSIVRTGSTISVYQNGALAGTISSATLLGGGALSFGRATGASYMFDLRVFNVALSANNVLYWYNDIVTFAGARTLPMA